MVEGRQTDEMRMREPNLLLKLSFSGSVEICVTLELIKVGGI